MLRLRAALVVTRIHYRSHATSSSRPSSSAAILNLKYSTLAAALASSGACLQFVPTTVAWTPSVSVQHRSFASVVRFPTNSRLQSTVTSDEAVATTPALTPTGNSLAEGTVVSFFQGGLVAVRIDDDEILSQTVSASTNATPRVADKSSIGGDLIGRHILFSNGQVGVVVTHRPPIVFVFTDMEEFVPDATSGKVKILDSLATLEVSEVVRVSDCFGRALEGTAAPSENSKLRPIFAPIPQVKDIALINTPMLTGITMIDALAPIGRGQNMLMVGHNLEDMRRYACSLVSTQGADTKCVYAATGDREETEKILRDAGVLEDVTLVAQQSKRNMDEVSAAAQSITIAATACAIGEAFALEEGKHALIIIDTIDQHKKLWDATTRVLVSEFGVEAVVKGDRDGAASSEMRAFYSALIQRSAQYNATRGGGSVTLLLLTTIPKMAGAEEDVVFSPSDFEKSTSKVRERIELLVAKKIPLTAANLRRIEIPIPSVSEGLRRRALRHIDELISMSDGQIWLDERFEQAGRQPPMDPQRSITRVGIGAETPSWADAPAIRRVAEGLRLDWAQAASMDGADLGTTAAMKQIRKSGALLLAMHQRPGSKGRTLSESCVALLAATKGHLDLSIDQGVRPGTEQGDSVMTGLFEHVRKVAPEATKAVDETQDMSESSYAEIESAIKSYFVTWGER